ncbi:MAG: hypothetical protein R8K49_04210 [Mariprofundaceae bacterium]
MATVFTYHVAKDDCFFAGHFPEMPVYPAVAQLGLLQQALSSYHKQACEITGLPMSKFLHPVSPDSTLNIELSLKKAGCMNFVVSSAQNIVAKGSCDYRVILS